MPNYEQIPEKNTFLKRRSGSFYRNVTASITPLILM